MTHYSRLVIQMNVARRRRCGRCHLGGDVCEGFGEAFCWPHVMRVHRCKMGLLKRLYRWCLVDCIGCIDCIMREIFRLFSLILYSLSFRHHTENYRWTPATPHVTMATLCRQQHTINVNAALLLLPFVLMSHIRRRCLVVHPSHIPHICRPFTPF